MGAYSDFYGKPKVCWGRPYWEPNLNQVIINHSVFENSYLKYKNQEKLVSDYYYYLKKDF